MKGISHSLVKKLWISISAAILITIMYYYFLSYFFYEKLYVENIEDALLEEGNRLANDNNGGI